MTTDNDANPTSLTSEERYDFFLDHVLEEKELWILVNENNEFLKIYAEDEEFEYLPVWPTSELAQDYASEDSSISAMGISLVEFLKKWVIGLTKDQLEVGVFPTADGSVWMLSAEELRNDIQTELSNM